MSDQETPDMVTLYYDNQGLLKRRGKHSLKHIHYRKIASVAKTNLASVKRMVTLEIEKTSTSKAALKEIVAGDDRVVAAANDFEAAKCKMASSEAKVDHIQELVNNNKVMMRGIEADKRNFGG